MRLDKWLKVSRLIKRRTIANELCDHARVKLNGKAAKASAEVKAGDRFLIAFGNRRLEGEVLEVPTGVVTVQSARTLYRIDQDIRIQEDLLAPAYEGD